VNALYNGTCLLDLLCNNGWVEEAVDLVEQGACLDRERGYLYSLGGVLCSADNAALLRQIIMLGYRPTPIFPPILARVTDKAIPFLLEHAHLVRRCHMLALVE
jgi:hypothetical protein